MMRNVILLILLPGLLSCGRSETAPNPGDSTRTNNVANAPSEDAPSPRKPDKTMPVVVIQIPVEFAEKSQGLFLDFGVMDEAQFAKTASRKMDSPAAASALVAWSMAFKDAIDEEPDAVMLLKFLTQLDPLWKDNALQEAVVKQYLARIKLVPTETVAKWRMALDAFADRTMSKTETLGYLVQFDSLFHEGSFQSKEADALLARAQSIPASAIEAWDQASSGKKVQVVLAVARAEGLFIDGKYQDQVGQETLRKLGEKATKD